MEFCKVAVTFESVDEILWCDHSNETSQSALSHGATCFSKCYKMKFGILYRILLLAKFGSEGVKLHVYCNFNYGFTVFSHPRLFKHSACHLKL